MEKEELSRYGYTWAGRGKPAELAPTERRDPADPYCPKWCRYACTGAWKKGSCLIRTSKATQAIAESCNERNFAIDTEQCMECSKVNQCDRWILGGKWKHQEGLNPCRPVPEYKSQIRPQITEEPIPNSRPKSCMGCIAIDKCKIDQKLVCGARSQRRSTVAASIDAEIEQEKHRQEQIVNELAKIRQNQKQTGIIDADQEQRARFSWRSMK